MEGFEKDPSSPSLQILFLLRTVTGAMFYRKTSILVPADASHRCNLQSCNGDCNTHNARGDCCFFLTGLLWPVCAELEEDSVRRMAVGIDALWQSSLVDRWPSPLIAAGACMEAHHLSAPRSAALSCRFLSSRAVEKVNQKERGIDE